MATIRNGIKAEKGYGPNSENSILCASPHIYEIMSCDHTNKDSQEEKLGGGKSLVTQAAIDEMLRRGAAYADIITVGKPGRWRGFTDSTEQLQNNSSACRSVRNS